MFSEQELAFLRTQPLARLATVAVNGQPDADAVGLAFENGRFSIGGYFLERTRKYKHIAAGQSKVSLLIDELRSLDPLEPRAIKLHGEAEILQLEEGFRGPGTYRVITPKVSWSSGIEGPAFPTDCATRFKKLNRKGSTCHLVPNTLASLQGFK